MRNRSLWIYVLMIVVLTGMSVSLGQGPAQAATTYTLTYTAGPNGTISGTSPQTVSRNGTGTLVRAVPNSGYDFKNWSDGSTANPRTDSLVTSNISVMAIFDVPPPAACSLDMDQSRDTDGDGFTDYQECYGLQPDKVNPLTLYDNTIIFGEMNCPGGPAICLSRNTKDLFVILVPAEGSNYLPQDPFQYVSKSISNGGLGIAVHQILPSQANSDRTVFLNVSPQKAVMVTENLDASKDPNTLGFSNTGTPNGLDYTTIFTQRIKNFIQTTCGCPAGNTVCNNNGASSNGSNGGTGTYGTSKCADPTGLINGDALLKNYILHTIAHEVGHVLRPLAPIYNADYGGYHYKSGTNVILDQSIYYTYTRQTNKTTFNIGAGFTSSDQTAVTLTP